MLHLLSSFPRRRESTSRQPKVKLQSLGISGVDASLRWHDEGMDSRLRGNDEAAEYKLLDFVIAGLTRNLSFFSYQKSELLMQVFRPKKPIWLVKINPHPAISLDGELNH